MSYLRGSSYVQAARVEGAAKACRSPRFLDTMKYGFRNICGRQDQD